MQGKAQAPAEHALSHVLEHHESDAAKDDENHDGAGYRRGLAEALEAVGEEGEPGVAERGDRMKHRGQKRRLDAGPTEPRVKGNRAHKLYAEGPQEYPSQDPTRLELDRIEGKISDEFPVSQ